jgi:hypothetical protein
MVTPTRAQQRGLFLLLTVVALVALLRWLWG